MSIRASYQYRLGEQRRGDQGVILILAVFAAVLLTILVVGISAAVRVELLASRASVARAQALFLAQAGISEAQAILLYEDQTVDSFFDDWGPWAEQPLDLPRQLGGGFYQVRVFDACGRIDVNRADYRTLLQLTGDPVAAASIVDWRDTGSEPISADGAETDYYETLPLPYLPRNAPFQTPGELLLVRGVTPALFFGSQQGWGIGEFVTVEALALETDALGRTRLDINTVLSQWGMVSREEFTERLGPWAELLPVEVVRILSGWRVNLPDTRYTSLAQVADALDFYGQDFLPLLDCLKVGPAQMSDADWYLSSIRRVTGVSAPLSLAKVNVNTAAPEVLAALPGSSEGLALEFVQRRAQAPFTSLREVAEVMLSQPDGRAAFAQMIDRVTTKSSSFIIVATGWTADGRGQRTLVALVRRLLDQIMLVRVSEQDWPLPPSEQELITMARR